MSRAIYIIDQGAQNLYHFLIYMLANLRHIEYVPDIIYIDLKKGILQHNYIIEILTALYPNVDLRDARICPPGCPSLQKCSDSISREAGISPEAYIYLRQILLPLLTKYTPKNTYSEYLYISRNQDSYKRRVVNEDELCKVLPQFQLLTVSGLPLLEQLYAISKAKVIISPHGAALSQIVVCREDVRIIEIASTKMSQLQHFSHIADTLHLSYCRYTDVIARDPTSYETDMTIINIQAFQSTLPLRI